MIDTMDVATTPTQPDIASRPAPQKFDPSHPSGAPPVIDVRSLTVSYGQQPVLRSISFGVPAGQLVGIVGPNGAGKSTLLRAILGLIHLDSGTVTLHGEPIEANRHRIAYVPQTEAVDWDFPVTVLDVVTMGRYARLGWFGRPKRKDRQAAVEALDMVTMGEFADRHIRQLSGGQQQRVFLARALCQHADVLLLDEPFPASMRPPNGRSSSLFSA